MLKLKATKPCRMLNDSGVLSLLDDELNPITTWKVTPGMAGSSLMPIARAYLSAYLLEVTREGQEAIHQLSELLGIVPVGDGCVPGNELSLDLTCRIEIYEAEASSSSGPAELLA